MITADSDSRLMKRRIILDLGKTTVIDIAKERVLREHNGRSAFWVTFVARQLMMCFYQ